MKVNIKIYLMLKIPSLVVEFTLPSFPSPLLFFVFSFPFSTSHNLQNFKFSSPAPVTTTSPPGLKALNNTLESCASLISAIRSMLGYACSISEFVGYPCVSRISLQCGPKRRDVTWDGVRREWRRAPVVVFQMCIVASFVPPPEARREGCQG